MNELIELLISSVNDEWRAMLLYKIQSTMLRGLWSDPIADRLKEESEDEEHHAEELTLHLFARGVEVDVKLPEISIGKDVEEMLRIDLQLEIQAIDKYTRIIQLCEPHAELMDTRMLAETILAEEIHHCDGLAALLRTKIKNKEIALKSASLIPLLQKTADKLDQLGRSEAEHFDSLIKEMI